jgi:hypothetical protein
MPQLDIVSFLSQFVWFFIFILFFYTSLSMKYLPSINKIFLSREYTPKNQVGVAYSKTWFTFLWSSFLDSKWNMGLTPTSTSKEIQDSFAIYGSGSNNLLATSKESSHVNSIWSSSWSSLLSLLPKNLTASSCSSLVCHIQSLMSSVFFNSSKKGSGASLKKVSYIFS